MKEKSNQGLDLKEGEGIRTAVDVVLFNKIGQVLLGKRKALAGENTWGFPGGHQKTGELIAETAQRELLEEIGDKAVVTISNDIIAVRENKISPWFVPHLTIMLKAFFEGGKVEVKETERCSEWQWFDLDELPENMFSGEKEILTNYRSNKIKVVTDWHEKS